MLGLFHPYICLQGLNSCGHLPAPYQRPPGSCSGGRSSVVWAAPAHLSLHLCPWSPARSPWAHCVWGPETCSLPGRVGGCLQRKMWSHHYALASVASLGIHRCPGDPLTLTGQQGLVLGSGPPCPNCWEGEKPGLSLAGHPQPQHLGDNRSPIPGLASELVEGLPEPPTPQNEWLYFKLLERTERAERRREAGEEAHIPVCFWEPLPPSLSP